MKERNEQREKKLQEQEAADQAEAKKKELENKIIFKNIFQEYCETNSEKKPQRRDQLFQQLDRTTY